MARMRTLKPEAATSESLAEVDRGVRWTFGMFWTHCDDEGRAVWNLRLIKAAIYPLDDHITIDVLADDFADLERIGAVCRYEIDGKEYIHTVAFGEHQHPNRKVPSKLPPCPKGEHSPTPHAQRSEPAVSTPEPLTPVVVVVGVVGEGDGEVDGDVGVRDSASDAIVTEWISSVPKRPPGAVIDPISHQVRQMLAEGIDPDDIRRGLTAWQSKRLSPSLLPAIVNDVMNAPETTKPNGKRNTDDKVRDGLALADRLAANEPSTLRAIGGRS